MSFLAGASAKAMHDALHTSSTSRMMQRDPQFTALLWIWQMFKPKPSTAVSFAAPLGC